MLFKRLCCLSRTPISLYLHFPVRRFVNNAVESKMNPVKISIKPDFKCLFDTPVQIQVEGLSPRHVVTFRTRLTDEAGDVFESSAHFEADDLGILDLCKSPSLGGDYVGVHPMGFLWGLKSQKPQKRMVKRDVTVPICIELSVEDQQNNKHKSVLAKCVHERTFLGDGVRRIPVKEGRIRAAVFLPPGNGPFPGVLELGGTAGGLVEYRGALLASHGFATMSVAYFGFDDLPKHLGDLDLEYFEEALCYFQNLPQVKKGGVGVLGISKGADLSLSMASFLDGITAVVCINGCSANLQVPLHYRGQTMPGLGLSLARITVRESGVLNVHECYNDPRDPENEPCVVPIERASARFLFVVGEDDQVWDCGMYAREMEKRLVSHGKRRPEILSLPATGHLLEPPYFPCCQVSYHKFVGHYLEWGGELESHSAGQERAWHKIKNFFQETLGGKKVPQQSKL